MVNCVPYLIYMLQLEAIQSQDGLDELLEEEVYRAAVLETGYRKPLRISEKAEIASTLKTDVLVRVKPELDQFCDGIKVCGVLEAMMMHPILMAPYFTCTSASPLTKGEFML